MSAKLEIKVGQRFNRLTIIKEIFGKNRRYFLCKCDCGKEKNIILEGLTNGHIQSCGCFRRDRMIKHGLSSDPLYQRWLNIKDRCANPKCPTYHLYGGRGITVCDEWRDDFRAFFEWCINAPNYNVSDEIDRINNNGNYEPTNCRWANRIIQCNNTRRNLYYFYKGRQYTLASLCRELNIITQYNKIYSKIHRKWDLIDTINLYI